MSNNNNKTANDDRLGWWYGAAITGTGSLASLAIAIVLYCNAIRQQTIDHLTVDTVIANTMLAEAFTLQGASTYAIGRVHGIVARQRAERS